MAEKQQFFGQLKKFKQVQYAENYLRFFVVYQDKLLKIWFLCSKSIAAFVLFPNNIIFIGLIFMFKNR